jgi:ABC-type branched-subunit amino acid transport system substrate-binding protein
MRIDSPIGSGIPPSAFPNCSSKEVIVRIPSSSSPRGRRRLLVAVVAALAVAATLIATGVASPKRSALTGTPITVMTIAPVQYNGPAFKNILEAARVYGDWINAHGGIKGHPLKVITCDERGDPNQLANCARQAVSSHAVAVVGSYSNNGAAAMPIVEKAKIAWFGGCCPTVPDELGNADSFPLGSGFGVIAGLAVKAGQICKKPALAVLDYPGKPFVELLVNNSLKASGVKLAKTVTFPLTVGGDLSPQIAELTSGTDCAIAALGEANWAAFLPAYKQSGAKVKLMGAQGNLDQKVIDPFASETNGAIVCGIYPDLSESVWKDYRAALKQYHADASQDYNTLGGLGAWAAYVAFTNIVKAIPGNEITNLTFLDQANKTTALKTGGLLPTIDLTKPWTNGLKGFSRVFNRDVTFQIVKNGKIVPLQHGFVDITNNVLGK